MFEECEAVDKCYPRGFYGVDKIGRPIYLDCTGKIDINGLFRAASEEKLMRDRFMIYEWCTKLYTLSCSALYDRQISQLFSILDLTGFSMALWNKKTIRLLKQALKINSDYYPEIMGKMVIANAPAIFTGVWAIVKGWIDEKTRKKIVVVGNPTKILSEFIDMDNLPIFMGG